jgi:hypothetical protein
VASLLALRVLALRRRLASSLASLVSIEGRSSDRPFTT